MTATRTCLVGVDNPGSMGMTEFLEQLDPGGDAPIPFAVLSELSGLSGADARELARAWAGWRAGRLADVLHRLSDLAEEDALLEFNSIFIEALDASDPAARVFAVRGLSECTDRRLIGRFARLLEEDDSEEVRASAAMGLARFATMARDGKLIARDVDRVRSALEAAVTDEREPLSVRRRALEAIAVFPDAAVGEYIRAGYESGDGLMIESALYAMGRSCSSHWLPDVLLELENANPGVRYEAVAALGELGEEGHVSYLAEMLEDEDALVASAAAEALAKLGGAAARRLLREAAEDGRRAVAESASGALSDLAWEDVLFEGEAGILGIAADEAAVAREDADTGDDTFDEADDRWSDRERFE